MSYNAVKAKTLRSVRNCKGSESLHQSDNSTERLMPDMKQWTNPTHNAKASSTMRPLCEKHSTKMLLKF